jgi:hypothetical protein
LDTNDLIGTLKDSGEYEIIPLKGLGPFNKIQISWFNELDRTGLSLSSGIETPLLNKSDWPENRPPIVRAQLIQFGSNFFLDAFSNSNAKTLFLYPSSFITINSFSSEVLRRSATGSPKPVKCDNGSEFSCKLELILPDPINGDANNRIAYLRLAALYNNAHYQIKLFNGEMPVLFNGVQPKIDSTGRANDLFRRVQARVTLSGKFTYPDAIYTKGNFCKDFMVTDTAYYSGSPLCTP